MANATYKHSTSNTAGTAVTSLVCAVPTVADGDFMLMYVTTALACTFNAVTGWNLLLEQPSNNFASGALYWRIASSEPGSYTPTWNTASEAHVFMITYSGVDTTDPFMYAYMTLPGDTSAANTHAMAGLVCNPATFVMTQWISWGRGSVTTTVLGAGWTVPQNPDSSGSDAASIEAAMAYKHFANASGEPQVGFSSSNSTTPLMCCVALRSNNSADHVLSVRSVGRISRVSANATNTPVLPPLHRAGSLLIAFIGCNGLTTAPTISQPGGWTQIGTVQHLSAAGASMAVFWKIDNGAESNPSFVWSAAPTTNNAMVLELEFADPGNPVLAFAQANDTASNTAYSVPALTLAANVPGFVLLSAVQVTTGDASIWNNPSGWANWPPSQGNPVGQFGVAGLRSAAANPGAVNFSGGTARTNVGFQIAIGQRAKLPMKVSWVG